MPGTEKAALFQLHITILSQQDENPVKKNVSAYTLCTDMAEILLYIIIIQCQPNKS